MTLSKHIVLFLNPIAADTIHRSLFLTDLIPQVQNGMKKRSEFRKSYAPLQLPPVELAAAFLLLVKLMNQFPIIL